MEFTVTTSCLLKYSRLFKRCWQATNTDDHSSSCLYFYQFQFLLVWLECVLWKGKSNVYSCCLSLVGQLSFLSLSLFEREIVCTKLNSMMNAVLDLNDGFWAACRNQQRAECFIWVWLSVSCRQVASLYILRYLPLMHPKYTLLFISSHLTCPARQKPFQ